MRKIKLKGILDETPFSIVGCKKEEGYCLLGGNKEILYNDKGEQVSPSIHALTFYSLGAEYDLSLDNIIATGWAFKKNNNLYLYAGSCSSMIDKSFSIERCLEFQMVFPRDTIRLAYDRDYSKNLPRNLI